MTAGVRPALVRLHRWFGLLAAPWLLLMALTGSVLVFHEEIDSVIAPEFHRVAPESRKVGPGPLALDRAIVRAEAAWPGAVVRFMRLPRTADQPLRLYLAPRPDIRPDMAAQLPAGLEVAADPVTGAVSARRSASTGCM